MTYWEFTHRDSNKSIVVGSENDNWYDARQVALALLGDPVTHTAYCASGSPRADFFEGDREVRYVGTEASRNGGRYKEYRTRMKTKWSPWSTAL